MSIAQKQHGRMPAAAYRAPVPAHPDNESRRKYCLRISQSASFIPQGLAGCAAWSAAGRGHLHIDDNHGPGTPCPDTSAISSLRGRASVIRSVQSRRRPPSWKYARQRESLPIPECSRPDRQLNAARDVESFESSKLLIRPACAVPPHTQAPRKPRAVRQG